MNTLRLYENVFSTAWNELYAQTALCERVGRAYGRGRGGCKGLCRGDGDEAQVRRTRTAREELLEVVTVSGKLWKDHLDRKVFSLVGSYISYLPVYLRPAVSV